MTTLVHAVGGSWDSTHVLRLLLAALVVFGGISRGFLKKTRNTCGRDKLSLGLGRNLGVKLFQMTTMVCTITPSLPTSKEPCSIHALLVGRGWCELPDMAWGICRSLPRP